MFWITTMSITLGSVVAIIISKKTLPSRWVPANDETKQHNRNHIECLRELLKERENMEEDVMKSQGGAQEGEEGGSVGCSTV